MEHSVVFSFSQTISPDVLFSMDFFLLKTFEIHRMCVSLISADCCRNIQYSGLQYNVVCML